MNGPRAFEVIPAIDLVDGRCVRLVEGDFARSTTYADDPVEVAKRFEGAGLRRLHLVDLDGARARRPVNLAVLERVAKATSLAIDWGGGVSSTDAARDVLAAGAAQLTAGSVAVRDPELVAGWLATWGPGRVLVGADFRDGHVAIDAWATRSDRTVEAFVEGWLARGATTFVCTDVSKDGRLEGPSLDAYAALRARFPAARLVASGGVTRPGDLRAVARLGLAGAIVGKALYEGTLPLDEAAGIEREVNGC